MERLNYNDEKVESLLNLYLQKTQIQKDCIDLLDLSSITNDNLSWHKKSRLFSTTVLYL